MNAPKVPSRINLYRNDYEKVRRKLESQFNAVKNEPETEARTPLKIGFFSKSTTQEQKKDERV